MASSAQSGGSKDVFGMCELNTRGVITKETMAEFGFVVDAFIKPKSGDGDEVAPKRIVTIDDDIVKLEDRAEVEFIQVVSDWAVHGDDKKVLMPMPMMGLVLVLLLVFLFTFSASRE